MGRKDVDKFVIERCKDVMVEICRAAAEMDRSQQVEFFRRVMAHCGVWLAAARGEGVVQKFTRPVGDPRWN